MIGFICVIIVRSNAPRKLDTVRASTDITLVRRRADISCRRVAYFTNNNNDHALSSKQNSSLQTSLLILSDHIILWRIAEYID